MAIHGYPGGIISATAPTTSPTSASGVWTLDDQLQAGANWPVAPSFLQRSLRFRSSATAYLSRTPSVAGNRKTWTWSGWVKRGALGVAQGIFGAGSYANGTQGFQIAFQADNTLRVFEAVWGSATVFLGDSVAVYRDPSAWYHIVVTFDTTQATSTNRLRVYVNGQQITLTNYTAPALNTDYSVNGTSEHTISRAPNGSGGSSIYFDGYLSDVNFIDGQALTPNYFGAVDAATGVWEPATYRGSYGTNGFYLPFTTITEYPVNNFSGASNIYWTAPNGAMAVGTGNFTCEFFFYATAAGNNVIGSGQSGTNFFVVATSANGVVDLYMTASGGGSPISSASGAWKLNQWNYVNINRSGGNVTVNVNGIAGSATSNTTNLTNASFPLVLGGYTFTDAGRWAGQISNFRFSNTVRSIAVPSAPLTSDANTLFLTAQSNSFVDNGPNAFTITNSGVTITTAAPLSSTISTDQSGNGNNWTAINISLSNNSTYDSMTDVPTLTSATTANYATFNPILYMGTGSTKSNGNLTFAGGGTGGPPYNYSIYSTFTQNTGKWYWEVTITTAGSQPFVGMFNTAINFTGTSLQGSAGPVLYGYDGNYYNETSGVAFGATYTTGDVIGVAVDYDNNLIWFSKNGTFQNSGVPATGTNGKTFGSGKTWGTGYVESGSSVSASTFNINFGQRGFLYTPPTGFVALNTFNLPTPTIGATASTQANRYFDISLWTGNGSTQTITGLNFQPDLVWLKSRSNAGLNNHLYDIVRGANKLIKSNLTEAEVTLTNGVDSFNSNGFSLGNDIGVNTNGATYVGWSWDAGGTGITNTAGSITSTVSANTSSGFSVVTYTGTSSNATVGHGLGVAPSMIIVKNRGNIGDPVNWVVYHQSLGNTRALYLNTTAAQDTSITLWNNTSPTSSVFSIGTGYTGTNDNGANYVAYCFAQIAGYSRFGSYTGNGSADGPFVFCGFRPAFVLTKCSSTTGNWMITDDARNPSNLADLILMPNNADQEYSQDGIDMLSNGFKMRASTTNRNTNGATYIYMAFAESPFKYANAR